MRYLLGADIGTSSTKVVLLNEKGKIAAEAQAPHHLYSPESGFNEQDPRDWWKAFVAATKKCLKVLKKKDSVSGIGLSGQMHGSVFLDGSGKVIRRALLWNDQRTSWQCEEITAKAGGQIELIRMVSNVALTGYTAPKILWLRQIEPENFAKLKKVLLPKDYINFCLTGEYSTDVSDASGTLLFDVKARKWSEELLAKLDLNIDLLPKVYESGEIVGLLKKSAAKEIGLKEGIPIIAGAGDQAAGAIGMGIVKEGLASATIGTSGVVFAATQRPFPNSEGRLQSFCHALPNTWCVFGCMLSAGASLSWFQSLFPKIKLEELLKGAARAGPGAGGLFFVPYLDGERCPHPDAKVRGAFLGLSMQTQSSQMARAVLEGVTFGMNEQIQILRRAGINLQEIRLGGGGAKSDFWRQLQADIYALPTLVLKTENAGALGMAILSGVSVGVWKDMMDASSKCLEVQSRKNPIKNQSEIYKKLYAKYQKIYPAIRDLF